MKKLFVIWLLFNFTLVSVLMPGPNAYGNTPTTQCVPKSKNLLQLLLVKLGGQSSSTAEEEQNHGKPDSKEIKKLEDGHLNSHSLAMFIPCVRIGYIQSDKKLLQVATEVPSLPPEDIVHS